MGFTVVCVSEEYKELLVSTVDGLRLLPSVDNIIVVDNDSTEESAEVVKTLGVDFILCDEGLEKASVIWNAVLDNFAGEQMLFINNGYALTEADLLMLNKTLSGDNVGIVGPMTNERAFSQYADNRASLGQYGDFDVIGVDAGCFAIKRDLFDRIGRFNEELWMPGSALQDYELKLLKEGYKTKVCGLAFAHVEKLRDIEIINQELIAKDREVLKRDWGMNYFNLEPNPSIPMLIDKNRGEEFSILEVGCDLGATLLECKKTFPNSKIFGLEINKNAVEIAKYLSDVRYGNIEEYNMDFEEKFDYIVFADVIEHLHDPERALVYCKEHLKPNGCIITSVPNLMHISVMQELLRGRFPYADLGLLDRTHIHFFTYIEMLEMFERAGYKDEDVLVTHIPLTEEQNGLIEGLMKLSGEGVSEHMFSTYQYIARFRME